MPATNLAQLLDFESHFEVAGQATLAAAGVTAYVEQTRQQLPLLNVGILFEVGPAFEERRFLTPPSNWPANTPPPQEYFRYSGTLVLRAECARDKNSTSYPDARNKLGELRGKIRSAFLRCVCPFPPASLPFYEVGDVRPGGALTGFESTRNVDFVELRFVVTWAILDSAWPAWIES